MFGGEKYLQKKSVKIKRENSILKFLILLSVQLGVVHDEMRQHLSHASWLTERTLSRVNMVRRWKLEVNKQTSGVLAE